MPENDVNTENELLTADVVARRLGVTRRTVEEWTKRFKLPHLKIGGKSVRYYWPEFQKALRENFAINPK
jgi:excisionase family DNA binding protein